MRIPILIMLIISDLRQNKENMYRLFFLTAFFVVFLTGCGKDITLVHVNDTHSHLFGSEVHCRYKGDSYNFTSGGLDLILQSVKDIRKDKSNVMFLHAGDLIQGTRYFREFQGAADVEIMNEAHLDALSLGNHEFDKGSEFLHDLLVKAQFPVVAANIEMDDDVHLKRIVKSYVVTGTWPFRNGVIGVVTPTTGEISSPGQGVRFTDPAEAVRKNIAELKKRRITRIFVLSHLGFEEDIKLAQNVEDIDIIIGGHSHTMLGYTGIDCLNVSGDYPHIVKDPSGRNVLVVQAWDHARAFGALDIEFDLKGEIQNYNGKTVYPLRKEEKIPFQMMLSPFNEFSYVNVDEDIKEKFDNYEESVSKEFSRKIGSISETLEHCWEKGSDIAPLVAEAILWKMNLENRSVDVALQNAGGVRKSLKKGDVTFGEVADTLPFFNNVMLFKISGADLVSALKNSVDNVFSGIHLGSFPYLAGMEFEITDRNVDNFKIIENGIPKPVDPERIYTVATDSYIAQGGNGYEIFGNIKEKEMTPFIVSDIFSEYIKEKKEICKPAKKHPAAE
ncbi:MAG TPA: bifunctional UDP-sugar hydrolase/5'-nucleotidase, partial [bacterium]|nr:bifunctional UDP-sugar hydrolase/5'-nucleotidase [bacterium]